MKEASNQGVIAHVYQRTVSGYLIFYSKKDFLVFYTIFSCSVARYNIKILGLCLMFDHIHFIIEAEDKRTISRFISHYTAHFVREYNTSLGRKGPLFRHRGMAVKTSGKIVRTAIAYVYNNPVEKKLCSKAEQWPWNFLAFAGSQNPFSERIRLARASAPLRRAIAMVKGFRSRGYAIGYAAFDILFSKLGQLEKSQLADFIIRAYTFISFNRAESFYGSAAKMLLAISSNTGSEYEIHEDRMKGSDNVYRDMAKEVRRMRMFRNVREVIMLPEGRKRELADYFLLQCGVAFRQIAKFLQLPWMPRHQGSCRQEKGPLRAGGSQIFQL